MQLPYAPLTDEFTPNPSYLAQISEEEAPDERPTAPPPPLPPTPAPSSSTVTSSPEPVLEEDDMALRPEAWDEFVGQVRLRAELDVRIVAALTEDRPLEPVLLCGVAGCGKTTMARLIAQRLGEPLLVISRPTTPRRLEGQLFRFESGVLFLDEIHRQPTATQEDLYPLLEDGQWETRTGGRIRFTGLTIVAATTEPQKLAPPLRDRFMTRPPYEPYTDDEMAAIVAQMADKAHVALDAELCAALAPATAGVPRVARQLVTAARALASAGHDLTADGVRAMCRLDPDGLTYEHRAYLDVLRRLGGTASLDRLAGHLRLHRSEIESLERLLCDRLYVMIDSTGRSLTHEGRRRAGGDVVGRRAVA